MLTQVQGELHQCKKPAVWGLFPAAQSVGNVVRVHPDGRHRAHAARVGQTRGAAASARAQSPGAIQFRSQNIWQKLQSLPCQRKQQVKILLESSLCAAKNYFSPVLIFVSSDFTLVVTKRRNSDSIPVEEGLKLNARNPSVIAESQTH